MTMWLPAQTALISAVTAAAVTLLLEYFVRPRTEARKDRFVDAARAWRELERLFLGAPRQYFGISYTEAEIKDLLPKIDEVVLQLGQVALHVKVRQFFTPASVLERYHELLDELIEMTNKPVANDLADRCLWYTCKAVLDAWIMDRITLEQLTSLHTGSGRMLLRRYNWRQNRRLFRDYNVYNVQYDVKVLWGIVEGREEFWLSARRADLIARASQPARANE
jgi:hypothetical protein